MTTIGQVTRQIAALEISSKPNTQGTTRPTGATHKKTNSQNGTNVSKLLSKFASTTSHTAGHTKTTSTHTTTSHTHASTHATTSTTATTKSRPASPTKAAAAPPKHQPQHAFDIGTYDGGLELDNESRGEKVTGEAAEDLALDSSVAR